MLAFAHTTASSNNIGIDGGTHKHLQHHPLRNTQHFTINYLYIAASDSGGHGPSSVHASLCEDLQVCPAPYAGCPDITLPARHPPRQLLVGTVTAAVRIHSTLHTAHCTAHPFLPSAWPAARGTAVAAPYASRVPSKRSTSGETHGGARLVLVTRTPYQPTNQPTRLDARIGQRCSLAPPPPELSSKLYVTSCHFTFQQLRRKCLGNTGCSRLKGEGTAQFKWCSLVASSAKQRFGI